MSSPRRGIVQIVCVLCLAVAGPVRYVSGGCLAGEFTCADGGCIPLSWRCDFWRDCRDASDETMCPCIKDETRCPSTSGDGRCLPVSWLCDGWPDCEGRSSDEYRCGDSGVTAGVGISTEPACNQSECTDDEVVCPNGRCIRVSWLCDGDNDCIDMWDETSCTRDWSPTEMINTLVHVTENGPQNEETTTTSDVAEDEAQSDPTIISDVTENGTPEEDPTKLYHVFENGTQGEEHAAISDVTTTGAQGDEFTTSTGAYECSWAAWSDWSGCPDACFARRQSRSRECWCPDGDFEDYDGCGTVPPNEFRTCALEGCPPEAAIGCGTRSPQEPVQRIVNGDTADVGAWPWQAQLRYQGSFICGGTLVGRRHVVTAAHCFNAFSGAEIASRWTVLLGKHVRPPTVSEGQHSSGVDQLIVHVDHDDDANTNDIAIIVLADPLPEGIMGNLMNIACLDVNSTVTFGITSNCFITGWGYLSYGGPVSDELQEANVPLIDRAICSSSMVYGDKIMDGMQCAGYLEGGIDSCTGDSGGPLVCTAPDANGALSRWYLAGIISWGKRCAEEYRPGVYTNVSHYMDWIINKTAGELY